MTLWCTVSLSLTVHHQSSELVGDVAVPVSVPAKLFCFELSEALTRGQD